MMVSEQTGRDATLQNYLSETEEFGQLILITGGAYQGKSGFAQQLVRELNRESGQQEPGMQENMHWTILEDVHLRIAEMLRADLDPWEEIQSLIKKESRLILTVQELGCGIVPVDAFDREWREVTGRICCELAKRAQAVYRMTCGIPARLK